ncbi:MAG: type II toxin-antitoxin system VapC family toxin [Candidatus Neomarinimicrobiota bacterium]
MKYLLDTCVISELVKKQPDYRVIEWIDAQDELELYLSVITFGEIQKSISKLDDPVRKQKIQFWLEDLKERFSGRIHDLDLDTLLTWGKNSGELSKEGKNVPSIDSLLGAMADQHKLCLVTQNVDDFKYCGVEIFNPWER